MSIRLPSCAVQAVKSRCSSATFTDDLGEEEGEQWNGCDSSVRPEMSGESASEVELPEVDRLMHRRSSMMPSNRLPCSNSATPAATSGTTALSTPQSRNIRCSMLAMITLAFTTNNINFRSDRSD